MKQISIMLSTILIIGSISFNQLRDNGFDGLVSEDCECGCELDDLMPCDDIGPDCQSGYKHKPDPDGEHPKAEWVMSTEKPEETTK